MSEVNWNDVTIDALDKENKQLKAERDRLREALQSLLRHSVPHYEGCATDIEAEGEEEDVCDCGMYQVIEAAQKTLEES